MMKKYCFAFLAIFGSILLFPFVFAEKSFGQLRDSDLFGSSVAKVGDLDGDGIGEVVVGAPFDDDGGVDRGAVWILFLNSGGTVRERKKVSSTMGGFSGQLSDYHRFGWSVSGLGDLDGDGVPELVVGAPYTPDGGTNKGAVYVLFLNADASVKSARKVSALTEPLLAAELGVGDFFGASVSGIEDLDGDSVPELVVGATYDDDGGTDRGAIYILFLNADGTVKEIEKISNTAGVGVKPVLDNGDLFGSSVAKVGDLDGDGIEELVVGATYDDDGGTDRGAIYILFLNADAGIKNFAKVSSGNGVDLRNSDLFGYSVSVLGDLDSDGVSDVVVGAFGDGDGGAYRGAVWILFLNADGSVKDRKKVSSMVGGFSSQLDNGDRFGASVSGLGDLDGDRIEELVVGATYDDDGGTDRGAIYVLFLEEIANSSGDFVSRVFDAGSSVSFGSLYWTPVFPFGEEQSSSDSDLVGLWHLNSKSTVNEVVDASGNSNTGLLKNGADVSALGLFETKALVLDGSNDYVSVANAASLNPSAITVEAWIKTSATNDYSGIVDKFVGTGYQINVDNLGRLRFDLGGSPYNTLVGTTNLETGAWFHVAATYDGSIIRVFVNGVEENNEVYAGGITSSGQALLIGNDSEAGGRFFNGLIDEVAVFNRALSASEILGHYRRGVNKLRFQARGCDDSACSGEAFVGPDGTKNTFFPSASQIWGLSFLPSNRFFQYKAFFETSDALISRVDPNFLKFNDITISYSGSGSFSDTTKADFDLGTFNQTKSNSPGDVQLFFDLSKNISSGKVSKFQKISHTKGEFTIEIVNRYSKISNIGFKFGSPGWESYYVSVAVLGDVDNDNIPDIAVPNGGFNVYFLSSNGLIKSNKLNTAPYGLTIDTLVDLNGDGIREFILTDQTYGDYRGAAHVVFLDNTGVVTDVKSSYGWPNTGSGVKANYGMSVVGIGGTATSGAPVSYVAGYASNSGPLSWYRLTLAPDGSVASRDLVSSPEWEINLWDLDEDGISEKATARGGEKVLLQFMDSSGGIKTVYTIESIGLGFGSSCYGYIPSAGFPCSQGVDILGDVDADGLPELIVAAARDMSAYVLFLQNVPSPTGHGCVDECSDGEVRCSSSSLREVCQQNSSGCWVWNPVSPLCSPKGVSSCDAATGVPRQCVVNSANNCLEWQNQTPVCNSGERQCSGLQPQECIIGGSGCLGWVDAGSVCSGSTPVCFGGVCVNPDVLFELRVSPVPLYEGQQLKVELEITSNTAKNYDVSLVVNKTAGGNNLFSLEKKGIVVDPAVSPSTIVGFYGPPSDNDFDTTGLVAGNYGVTVKATDSVSGKLAFEKTVFIAVIPELQAMAVPELHSLFSIAIALTVLLVVLRKSRNK